jgi:hypothetical protein
VPVDVEEIEEVENDGHMPLTALLELCEARLSPVECDHLAVHDELGRNSPKRVGQLGKAVIQAQLVA